MAGLSSERQESKLIDDIKSAIKKNKNNAVTVIAGKTIIPGVIDAYKFKGRQVGGSEPYTDVVLEIITSDKNKTLNLSLKGESAPSLAGGGLKGIELAVPGIAKKFMLKAFDYLVKEKKLNAGDKVPDVYAKISKKDKVKIVVGNAQMGGPIDYMYIGPMNVVSKYDVKKNQITLNGKMVESKNYAEDTDLYFRLRSRREDQRFDPEAKDNKGVPKIYGKSIRGDSAGRIVVTDSVPQQSIVVNLT